MAEMEALPDDGGEPECDLPCSVDPCEGESHATMSRTTTRWTYQEWAYITSSAQKEAS